LSANICTVGAGAQGRRAREGNAAAREEREGRHGGRSRQRGRRGQRVRRTGAAGSGRGRTAAATLEGSIGAEATVARRGSLSGCARVAVGAAASAANATSRIAADPQAFAPAPEAHIVLGVFLPVGVAACVAPRDRQCAFCAPTLRYDETPFESAKTKAFSFAEIYFGVRVPRLRTRRACAAGCTGTR